MFDILVGTSSEDIALCGSVNVRIADPFGISVTSGIGTVAKDREAVEIINRIMEDDIEILCVVALNYAPDKTFEELWNGVNVQDAMKAKGWDDTEIAVRYAQIENELKLLNEYRV